jgi:hypothetical protein
MIMKNALILHGTGNNSQGNWFPWLKKELEKDDWKVWVPDLPDSKNPSVKKINEYIFANKDWQFNEESILVGHSSGAVAILGLLQKLPDDIQVNKCYLIGSFKDDFGLEHLSGLFTKPFDFAKIRKHAKKFILIHSDNDPYCPLDHAEYLSRKLDGELIVIKGQGHFNLENSPKYREFPELLKIIEKNI